MLINFLILNWVYKNINLLIYKNEVRILNYYFFYKNEYIYFLINFLIRFKFNYKLNFFITGLNSLILFELYLKNIFFKTIKKDIFFKNKINVISFKNFKMKLDVVSFLLLLHFVESFRRVKYNEYICNGLFLSSKIISNLAKIAYYKDILLAQWLNLKHIFYFYIWKNSYIFYYLKSSVYIFPLILNKYLLNLFKRYDIYLIFIKNIFNKYLRFFLFFFSKYFIIFFFYKFIMFRGNSISSRFLARLKYLNYKKILKANTKYSWNIRMFRFFLYLKTWYYKSIIKDNFIIDFYNYEYISLIKFRFYYNILIIFVVQFLKNFLTIFLYDFLTYTLNIKLLVKNLVNLHFIFFINLKNNHLILSKIDLCLWLIYESDLIKSFYVNCLTLSNYYRKLDFDNLLTSRLFLFHYYSRIRLKLGNVSNFNNFNLLFFYYFFNSIFLIYIKNSNKYCYIFQSVFYVQYYYNLINIIFRTLYYDIYINKLLIQHYD